MNYYSNLPIYKIMVTNTIKPNHILNALQKKITATKISVKVGAIEKKI